MLTRSTSYSRNIGGSGQAAIDDRVTRTAILRCIDTGIGLLLALFLIVTISLGLHATGSPHRLLGDSPVQAEIQATAGVSHMEYAFLAEQALQDPAKTKP